MRDAGANGTVGPNLDEQVDDLVAFVVRSVQ